ncbi:MAG: hypothetical protein JXJ20_01915 [Anaerolineae bacterium]|nr:hypothetical protein [Anaerolineae bacterium]
MNRLSDLNDCLVYLLAIPGVVVLLACVQLGMPEQLASVLFGGYAILVVVLPYSYLEYKRQKYQAFLYQSLRNPAAMDQLTVELGAKYAKGKCNPHEMAVLAQAYVRQERFLEAEAVARKAVKAADAWNRPGDLGDANPFRVAREALRDTLIAQGKSPDAAYAEFPSCCTTFDIGGLAMHPAMFIVLVAIFAVMGLGEMAFGSFWPVGATILALNALTVVEAVVRRWLPARRAHIRQRKWQTMIGDMPDGARKSPEALQVKLPIWIEVLWLIMVIIIAAPVFDQEMASAIFEEVAFGGVIAVVFAVGGLAWWLAVRRGRRLRKSQQRIMAGETDAVLAELQAMGKQKPEYALLRTMAHRAKGELAEAEVLARDVRTTIQKRGINHKRDTVSQWLTTHTTLELASILMLQGRYTESAAILREGITDTIMPNWFTAQVAWLYFLAGDLGKARTMLALLRPVGPGEQSSIPLETQLYVAYIRHKLNRERIAPDLLPYLNKLEVEYECFKDTPYGPRLRALLDDLQEMRTV